jgi:hypothetical protein
VVSATPFPASGVGGCLREGVARWPWMASGMGTDENITCHPTRYNSPIKIMRTQSDTRQIHSSPTVATTDRIHRWASETDPSGASAGSTRRMRTAMTRPERAAAGRRALRETMTA